MLNMAIKERIVTPITNIKGFIKKRKEENLLKELENVLKNNGIDTSNYSKKQLKSTIKGLLECGANDCTKMMTTIEMLLDKDRRLEKIEKTNLNRIRRILYRGYLSNTDRRRNGQAAIRFKQLEKTVRQMNVSASRR